MDGIKGGAGVIYTITNYAPITANRWFAQRYNVNNAWNFNGNNGNLNNNNVNNTNQVQAVANLFQKYIMYDRGAIFHQAG